MPATDRRYELDWIRIGAFGLLILYHCGMYYTTWGWHVKSPVTSRTLDVVMLITNPWRLGLLFVVSGAATRFMSLRLAAGGLAGTRSRRLLIPLAFGMLVVVPPQAYYEVVEKLGYGSGFLEFYLRYLAADQNFCPAAGCLILPTWNHLWFVAYLWAYTMVLAVALWLAPEGLRWAEAVMARIATGWNLLIVPAVYLALMRLLLRPLFGSTHALFDDWYNHAVYLPLFAIGFLLARADTFWKTAERLRWPALGLAVLAYLALALAYVSFPAARPSDPLVRAAIAYVYGADQWCWIVAILGFGRRWFAGVDGPWRRYLTDAVFPFYIVHQTVIVVVAHHLRMVGLPVAVEAAVILTTTALACIAVYEIVRRIGPLRPLFGLKRVGRSAVPSCATSRIEPARPETPPQRAQLQDIISRSVRRRLTHVRGSLTQLE